MNIAKLILLVFLITGVVYIIFLMIHNRLSKHIQILNVDEFEKQLATTKDALIIDVRTPREYKKHRIAGAISIDYLNVNFRREIKKLDKSKPAMVYCHSGYRSKMALPTFSKAGYKTIYELDSGFNGWFKSNKPIKSNNNNLTDNV